MFGETTIFHVKIWFIIQLKQPFINVCFRFQVSIFSKKTTGFLPPSESPRTLQWRGLNEPVWRRGCLGLENSQFWGVRIRRANRPTVSPSMVDMVDTAEVPWVQLVMSIQSYPSRPTRAPEPTNYGVAAKIQFMTLPASEWWFVCFFLQKHI